MVAALPRVAVYRRPKLYPKQEAALFDPARYSAIEASTKSGKTVGAMAWLGEQALIHGRSGRNYWWVAPILAQSKIAFRRFKRGLPRQVYVANEGEMTLTLANGAMLWFKGGDHPDSLYGEDIFAAVIDEASRVKEDAWHAVRSTLTATQGPLRIIGNVKGRKNWFYRLARRAESGEPNMAYHRITADDAIAAGVLAQEEIDDARRQLPEAVFRELYEAEASDDAGNPFGLTAIRACVGPLSVAAPDSFGVDLAKSVDWSVVIGLDKTGATCRFDRWQSPWQETLARIRAQVGSVRAKVDSTGVGDPIVEALQRGGGNYESFKFTAQSKQQLMEGLAVAIQQGRIRYPAGVIVNELEGYEYVYTRGGVQYSAPAGQHDDTVCALALAVAGQRQGQPNLRFL